MKFGFVDGFCPRNSSLKLSKLSVGLLLLLWMMLDLSCSADRAAKKESAPANPTAQRITNTGEAAPTEMVPESASPTSTSRDFSDDYVQPSAPKMSKSEEAPKASPPSAAGAVAPPRPEEPVKRKRAASEDKAGGGGTSLSRPASTGVKAGSADDNLQFNAFLGFLDKNSHSALKHEVMQRIMVNVRDRDGLPLPDAEVTVWDQNQKLLQRRTYADGRALIFPSESSALQRQSSTLKVWYKGKGQSSLLAASKRHRIDIRLDLKRSVYQSVPLDIAFVLDTTGSMGDEIERLKKTIDYINFQISSLTPRPDVRFGMVLYRDKGDEYRTRQVPFTPNLTQFRKDLNLVQAGGGGDTPEDVQEALGQAITQLQWRPTGVKVVFLIGDAPPHLDYGQTYTYIQAMQDAAQRGIKIATIGASGLDLQGEVVWRQLAQYTLSPFVFLTRGETGDSEGSVSSVSHHVGSNWMAENLDAIIIRMVKVELSHYSPKGTQPLEDFFTASHNDKVRPEEVMRDLFQQVVKQLVDYSVLRIEQRTPTVVLPVKPATNKLQGLAQKLETRLAVNLSQAREFQLVESKDLSSVIKAQSAQLTETYDGDKAVKLGKLLPAKLAILSRIEASGPDKIEMLIKLVRLETGEILSLSLLKIETDLLRL